MNLNERPEVVTFPETHYLFIEKIGSFMNTAPQAWKEIHGFAAQIAAHNEINGYMSLYDVEKQIHAFQRRQVLPLYPHWLVCQFAGSLRADLCHRQGEETAAAR